MLKGNLKAILADKLSPEELQQMYKSYDLIGEIAVIRIPQALTGYTKLIAQTVMQTHGEVKSVWKQCSSVSGDYRLRNLEHIMGKKTTETRYKEHGCIYKTDLQKTYFSPRLSYERLRIAKLVQKEETIVNMFAGVGCYSIDIAKRSDPKIVYSIDLNPIAFNYLTENIELNKVEKCVVPILGDAKTIIENSIKNIADRVLMPLPELAFDYLDYAVLALKPERGWLHYQDFVYAKKGENPVQKVEIKVSEKLSDLCRDFSVNFGRAIRQIGPRWYQIVLDTQVTK